MCQLTLFHYLLGKFWTVKTKEILFHLLLKSYLHFVLRLLQSQEIRIAVFGMSKMGKRLLTLCGIRKLVESTGLDFVGKILHKFYFK